MFDPFDIEHQVQLLRSYFFNRDDRIVVMAPWDRPCPAAPEDPIRDILLAHVGGPEYGAANVTLLTKTTGVPFYGPLRVGTYFPDPDGKVCVACIDFDDHDSEVSLSDPFNAAYDVAERAWDWGLQPYLELSGGGQGVHLWLFFDRMLDAAMVRAVLLYLVGNDLPLVNGEKADPARSVGVEVFPKSGRVAPGGVGSGVWLPFWHGATEDANQFFRYVDQGGLDFYAPESFKRTNIPTDLQRLAEEDLATRRLAPTPAGPLKGAYQAWRIEALNKLDLSLVYGPWLTGGEPQPGYLECRDALAESEDFHPSASVQTGEAGTTRGRFHSFIRDEGMSVFDFLIALPGNGINTLGEALRHVAELSGVPLPDGRA
jgi:hypothetical protein